MSDQAGDVVWYYEVPRQMGLMNANSFIQLRSGNLLYLATNVGFEEIGPDARLVRRVRIASSPLHHDMLELSDGRVLFVGSEVRELDASLIGGPPNLRLRGDTLNVLDLAADTEAVVWSAFDFLDPLDRAPQWLGRIEEGAEYWTHANSVSLGPRGNVLFSLRHLDQVISLSPDLSTIEWKLGGRGSSFHFPNAEDLFYGQHSAYEVSEGRLLLFDNGNYRPEGDFSRGLELALDFETMAARKAWEYRHQPDIFSSRISSVARLSNGNTLVNFGFREDPDEPVLLVESRPDGTTVWQQSLSYEGRRISRFRALPFDSLRGEQSVVPTSVVE
jgi:hypothetical protein